MKKGFILCLFALGYAVFGAEITVPELDLASRGAMEGGDFNISSSMEAVIAIDGGYKYGFSLGLGAEIPNLQKAFSYGRMELPYASLGVPDQDEYEALIDALNNQAVVSIRSLSATVREIFGAPLEASFFIGRYDTLGSGDEFPDYFGVEPIGTGLRGFYYYPEGLNGDPFLRFNGAMHNIMGTGLAFKAMFGSIVPVLYIYHDLSFPDETSSKKGAFKPGCFSADLKLLINSENAKFELFMGGTYVHHGNVVLRGGALAWLGTGPVSFLIQAGITAYEVESDISLDNFYFLMEPRLRFAYFGATFTFFFHPVFYMNKTIMDGTNRDRGRADFSLKLFFGDINKSTFEAGLESIVNMKMYEGEEYNIWISPFFSTVTTGLRWDFALRFNPRYFWDKGELMEGFIGIRTSF